MLADMERADELFRPTNFWQTGLTRILDDLDERGFDDFRSHESARVFYVPLYGRNWAVRPFRKVDPVVSSTRRLPGSLRAAMEYFAGKNRARAEYRIFRAAIDDRPPLLADLSESNVGAPAEQFELEGRRYSRSFLNYLRGLALLKKHADLSVLRHALEIGGGYGTLGEILQKAAPGTTYVDVDIPPVAAVATYYLSQVFGEDRVLAYDESRELAEIDLDRLPGKKTIAVLCPWQLPRLKGGADLFVNMISFQEMEPHVVSNYVRLVSPLTRRWVLLRNSRHGKTVARGPGELGVVRPVTTDMLKDEFADFGLLARDAATFGEVSVEAGFESEVLCLARKS